MKYASLETLEGRQLLAINLAATSTRVAQMTQTGGGSLQVSVDFLAHNATKKLTPGSVTVQVNLIPHPFTQADLSTLSFDDPSAIVLGTGTLGGFPLHASGTYTAQITGTIPSNATPGAYAVMYKLDTTNAIAEPDETDNIGMVTSIFQVRTPDGRIEINGTDGPDSLFIQRKKVGHENRVYFDPLNVGPYYHLGEATGWDVKMLGGNDKVEVVGLMNGLFIQGGDGNDDIIGGIGEDTISGGAGKDSIFGGFGNDRLNGNGGNDWLFGVSGNDRLFGNAGNDSLSGGLGSDKLDGGAGNDTLVGDAGKDIFFVRDGSVDEVHGDSGVDTADADVTDLLYSIQIKI